MRVLPEFRRVLLAELRAELNRFDRRIDEADAGASADSRRKRSLPTAVAIPDIVPGCGDRSVRGHRQVIAAIGIGAVFPITEGLCV
jgi:hypothetical protein